MFLWIVVVALVYRGREIDLWREIIDCVFSFLSASLRTHVLVTFRYLALR